MTDDKLADLARRWVVAEENRKTLKRDRALAIVVARRRGVDLIHDGNSEHPYLVWDYDTNDIEQTEAVAAAIRIDHEYQKAWRKAAGLRGALKKAVKPSRLAMRKPDKEIQALYDDLCKQEQTHSLEDFRGIL